MKIIDAPLDSPLGVLSDPEVAGLARAQIQEDRGGRRIVMESQHADRRTAEHVLNACLNIANKVCTQCPSAWKPADDWNTAIDIYATCKRASDDAYVTNEAQAVAVIKPEVPLVTCRLFQTILLARISVVSEESKLRGPEDQVPEDPEVKDHSFILGI